MKRLVMAAVIIMISASAVFAKKPSTVEFKDNVLKDSVCGYTLNIAKNWKVVKFNEPNIQRVYLQKKNYSVNPKLKEMGGDYTIPTVTIFSEKFDGTPENFEALIKKCLEEHKSDDKIVNQMGLLVNGEFINSSQVTIDSSMARQVLMKRNYKRVLTGDNLSGGINYINDHEVHEIYIMKKGDNIYVIQCYCEREYYLENQDDFHSIVSSFKFID